MILKFLGSFFILGASVIAGFYYGNVETYRMNDLRQMKKALAILKSEIEYSLTPLPEALVIISERTAEPINQIFLLFAELLDTHREEETSELWFMAIDRFKQETYFNKEDIEQFATFGKTLGYLDKGMQLGNISHTTSYIDEKISSIGLYRDKNKKMFQTLGVLGGVLTIIVFL